MQEQVMRQALKSWLTGVFAQSQTLVFSLPLVSLNVISGNVVVGGITTPISVTFATSNAVTLQAIATAIQAVAGVNYAYPVNANTIQINSLPGTIVTLTGWNVTLGASQAVVTVGSLIQPIPIMYDYQALPATGPFVTYKIGTVVSKGYDTSLGFNSSYLFNKGGLREATITISYFGYSPENGVSNNYAPQSASRISDSLELPSVQGAFNAQGLAFLHKNPIQQLTYLLESKYQPRADFDFYLGFVANEIDNLSYIESVTVTGTVHAGNETETIIEDIP